MSQEMRTKAIALLREAGISPSEPRIAILSYLRENRTHPTIDMIFRALHELHPTLSRTTVYSTLKLLAAHHLASGLAIEDNEIRYDGDTCFHAHFKCRVCGRILDVFNVPPPVFPEGHSCVVEEVQTHFYGLCGDCAAGRKSQP